MDFGVDVVVDGVQHILKGTVTLVPGDNLASLVAISHWHLLFASAGSVWLLMKICKRRYKCVCACMCVNVQYEWGGSLPWDLHYC